MELIAGVGLQGGKYRILEVLGKGGFGITYLADHVVLGRKVAIKEFFMKEHCNRDANTSYVSVPSIGSREHVNNFKAKFLKEARLIATFSNIHIISIYDVFEENGTAYYVMEYLEGKSLKAYIDDNGALPEDVAIKYIRQVGKALSEVHSHNLLHLDIKPANIMLNKRDEAVLIDFGISKHYDEKGSQTTSGILAISEGYAPMEQYKKGGISLFTPATDVYSLGATLFKLLTGKTPPHAGDVYDEGLPALPVEFSASTRAAIEAAMQPRRKDRPQSVNKFLALLDKKPSVKEPKDAPVVAVAIEESKAATPVAKRVNNKPTPIVPARPAVANPAPAPPSGNVLRPVDDKVARPLPNDEVTRVGGRVQPRTISPVDKPVAVRGFERTATMRSRTAPVESLPVEKPLEKGTIISISILLVLVIIGLFICLVTGTFSSDNESSASREKRNVEEVGKDYSQKASQKSKNTKNKAIDMAKKFIEEPTVVGYDALDKISAELSEDELWDFYNWQNEHFNEFTEAVEKCYSLDGF